MMANDSGYTPLRRRDQAQLCISPATSGLPPWTTARCNRLLRPISSRIALLRKHKQRYNEHDLRSMPHNSFPGTKSVFRDAADLCRLGAKSLVKPENDPDWAPDHGPRKRLKRTYSSRTAYHSTKYVQPLSDTQNSVAQVGITIQKPLTGTNELLLEHPAAQDTISGNRQSGSALDTKDAQSFTRESFRRLAKSISPTEWMLIDGLYNGLKALLKATNATRSSSSTGARSLFSSCLRTIPEYILEEQRLLEAEDPDTDVDVASIIYGDLESYGLSASEGWKPLKDVARAHGVAILATAVNDGSIGPSIARGLVILCVQGFAFNEAQILLASLAGKMKPISKPKSVSERLFGPEKSIYLYTLHDFSHRSGHYGFFYQQLGIMISNGMVPIEWISSPDMVECWNRVVWHIKERDSYAQEAHTLLKIVVSMSHTITLDPISCDVHRLRLRIRTARNQRAKRSGARRISALSFVLTTERGRLRDSHTYDEKTSASITSTISNLITVLLSIDLIHFDTLELEHTTPYSTGPISIPTLALEALQSYYVSLYNSASAPISNAHMTLLSMPLFAFELENTDSSDTGIKRDQFTEVWLNIATNSRLKAVVTERFCSLLSNVARCCGTAGSKKGFEYLQRILRPLLDLSKSQDAPSPVRLFIHRIAIQAAFKFAEESNQREHLTWAIEMEKSDYNEFPEPDQLNQGRTPKRSSTLPSTGFRWEEGIGEWVARTPATMAYRSKPSYESHGRCTSDEDEEVKSKVQSVHEFPLRNSRVHDLYPHGLQKGRSKGVRCRASDCVRVLRGSSPWSECSGNISQSDFGTSIAYQKLLPRTNKISKPRTAQFRWKANEDIDELSIPELCQQQVWPDKRATLGELKNLALNNRSRRRGVGKPRAKSLGGLPLFVRHWRKPSVLDGFAQEDGSEDELGV